MFQVRFNACVARLREILKNHEKYMQEGKLSSMATHLQQLNIAEDQLFISLLFYTKQELWKENCAMFRALNVETIPLPPSLFTKLVDMLNLRHLYITACCLPLDVCNQLISILCNDGDNSVLCLEDIVKNITRSSSDLANHLAQVLHRILNLAKPSLKTLVECVAWLQDQPSKGGGSDIIDAYVASEKGTDLFEYSPRHTDCVMRKDYAEADKQSISDNIVSVISKQYTHCFHSLISQLLLELLVDLSTAEAEDNLSVFCRRYCDVRRILAGYRLIANHKIFTSVGESTHDENADTGQHVIDSLAQADSYLLNHEKFMSMIVQSAASSHDERRLTMVSSHIMNYLTNSRVRELLVSHSAGMRWSQEQSRTLLHTLKSAFIGSTPTNHSAPYIADLQKISLQALCGLDPKSTTLQFEFLSEYSECFSDSQTRSLINLSLNKIRPQSIGQCRASSNTLSALLSLRPGEVIKSLTYQILRSTSSLAAIMCQIYMSVMSTSMLPLTKYLSYMDGLELNRQQLDDLLSKTLLFLPQCECPVASYLFGESVDRLYIRNEHLSQMLKNMESVLISGNDVTERFDNSLLSSIALFLLSIVDSVTMVTTEKSERDGLLRLALRLLTTSQISDSINNLERLVVEDVIKSLHPNTHIHLKTEGVLIKYLRTLSFKH